MSVSLLMSGEELNRALNRMARQILELTADPTQIVLVGIHTRGVPLARRLAAKLAQAGAPAPRVGELDINLYRDDLSRVADRPVLRATRVGFPIDDRIVVLVDDVIFTGRTVRAALDALTDLGRPRLIRLAELIDRGGRELPIQPDLVGRIVAARPQQIVDVRLRETDDAPDEVVLRRADDPPGSSRRRAARHAKSKPRPKARVATKTGPAAKTGAATKTGAGPGAKKRPAPTVRRPRRARGPKRSGR